MTYREELNRELTTLELDGNFKEIDAKIQMLSDNLPAGTTTAEKTIDFFQVAFSKMQDEIDLLKQEIKELKANKNG